MRRIGLAAAAVALVALGAVVQHLVASGHSSVPPPPPTSTFASAAAAAAEEAPVLVGAMNMGIAYGLTPEQVLRRIGAPTRKHGSCWLYSGAQLRGPRVEAYTDAMKFCFGAGSGGGHVVTAIATHMYAHTVVLRGRKLRVGAGWGPPLDFEPSPGPYVGQIWLP